VNDLSPESQWAVVIAERDAWKRRALEAEDAVEYWKTEADTYEQTVLELEAAKPVEMTTPFWDPLRPSMAPRRQAMGESTDDYQLREQM
jgi:hypothetical protein